MFECVQNIQSMNTFGVEHREIPRLYIQDHIKRNYYCFHWGNTCIKYTIYEPNKSSISGKETAHLAIAATSTQAVR